MAWWLNLCELRYEIYAGGKPVKTLADCSLGARSATAWGLKPTSAPMDLLHIRGSPSISVQLDRSDRPT